MKDLFMCLLLNLTTHGNITEANMYAGGELSSIKLKNGTDTYTITVSKVKEESDGNI